jgi:hypothetical protein
MFKNVLFILLFLAILSYITASNITCTKDFTTTVILSIFTGSLGIDRLYIGHQNIGIVKVIIAGFNILTIPLICCCLLLITLCVGCSRFYGVFIEDRPYKSLLNLGFGLIPVIILLLIILSFLLTFTTSLIWWIIDLILIVTKNALPINDCYT